MKKERMRRVNELLQRELGTLCERQVASEVDFLLTITAVKTSPDLRQAQVFFSVLGDDRQWTEGQAALDRHRIGMQAAIGRTVKLKYTPVLQFKPDPTLEQADRVFSIIQQLDLPDEAPEESRNSENDG